MKLSILTKTLICRSFAAAKQLRCMFLQAVPPETSRSFCKGPRPTPAKHLPGCHWLGDSFLLHFCCWVESPDQLETSAIFDHPLCLCSHLLKAGPSPPNVSTVALFQPQSTDCPRLLASSVSPASPVFLLYPCHHTSYGSPLSRIKPDFLQFDWQSSSQSGTAHLYRPTSNTQDWLHDL